MHTKLYASALSAALAYHFGAVVLAVIELLRNPPSGLQHALHLNLPMQNLAVFAAAFLLRACVVRLRRGRQGMKEAVVGDLCVFGLIVVVFCVVSLPFDTSGAALFGIIVMTMIGVPLVIATSLLSQIAAHRRWVSIVLAAVAALDVLALIVSSGMSLVAQP
ncbi:hypothetical protein [Microbacterium terrisoli]|jgi:hypothetical protein|uniref:hypothetical protein n=1 Tax=Microbacterium terrisoli TaxID=3242192 RepID=UPI0028044AE7|nr:hypothetical protein [Microbacterium protaetiae]